MAILIRNLVPYHCRINAVDTNSGKKLSNTFYMRNTIPTGAYGSALTGSDLATLEDSLFHKWFDTVNPVMNLMPEAYMLTDLTLQAIIGKEYPTPVLAITNMTTTLTETVINTATPHGFSTGNQVIINNVISPADANGSFFVSAVDNPTTFRRLGVISAAWGGFGFVQLIRGNMQWFFADRLVVAHNDVGQLGIEETIPLFSGISMRRLNLGVGRNFKSRISIAPIAEIQNENGRLEPTALTNWTTAGASLNATLSGGGGWTMEQLAVSKQLSFLLTSPFNESDSWTKPVTAFLPQPNMGSFIKRKPKLSALIS